MCYTSGEGDGLRHGLLAVHDVGSMDSVPGQVEFTLMDVMFRSPVTYISPTWTRTYPFQAQQG